jgi:Ca2+:H+ antiporter
MELEKPTHASLLADVEEGSEHSEEMRDNAAATTENENDALLGGTGGADAPYLRSNSKEWADSMLQWDGSRPSGYDNPTVIADYDDLQASSGSLAQASVLTAIHENNGNTSTRRGVGGGGAGLKINTIALMKARSRRAREDLAKRKAAAKKVNIPWDEMFTPWSDFKNVKDAILSNWINLMMFALPFAIASHLLGWPALVVFILNLVAVVPLALLLGEITEDLAIRFGDVWGGLINATFGNVVEMILSIALLMKGLTEVVSTSLIGSILSNLLLVIGCCFFVGGLNFKHQRFSSGASKANTSLLFMSCIAMLLPSMISYSGDKHDVEKVKEISHIIALVLTGMYVCYLYFQLVTHNHVFMSEGDNSVVNPYEEEEGEEKEEPQYSFLGALLLMGLTTCVVAICSEFLSDSIEEVSKKSGLSLSFIGMIVLPIAGNACEHITAVLVAAKNKMDLAIAVGVGSSIQIAIFVYPFVVLVGWVMGVDFTMRLNQFDVMVVCVSVILAAFVTMDGQSHWFTGLMLIGTYVLIAIAYFF